MPFIYNCIFVFSNNMFFLINHVLKFKYQSCC